MLPLAVEKEDEFVENEVGHRVPAGTKRKPSGQPADRAAIAVTFCRGGSEKLEKPSEEAIEHCLFFRGRAPRQGAIRRGTCHPTPDYPRDFMIALLRNLGRTDAIEFRRRCNQINLP